MYQEPIYKYATELDLLSVQPAQNESGQDL